jgi:hypothetical protein
MLKEMSKRRRGPRKGIMKHVVREDFLKVGVGEEVAARVLEEWLEKTDLREVAGLRHAPSLLSSPSLALEVPRRPIARRERPVEETPAPPPLPTLEEARESGRRWYLDWRNLAGYLNRMESLGVDVTGWSFPDWPASVVAEARDRRGGLR